MDQDERIKAEYDRLAAIFMYLDENRRTVADGLIREAAYMSVAMDDLKETIRSEGMTERYQNGENQYGFKESAALRSYNNLTKTYKSIIDKLMGITPIKRDGVVTTQERWSLKSHLKYIDEASDEYRNSPEYLKDVDEVIKEARAFMEKLYPHV